MQQSATASRKSREGIEIDLSEMMDVAMEIKDGHKLKR